jgi:hypothetical protein
VDIEFDSAKDAANIAKHGVSLEVGGFIIENAFHVEKDDRHDYGEERFNAFALIEGLRGEKPSAGSYRFAKAADRSSGHGNCKSHSRDGGTGDKEYRLGEDGRPDG